MPLPLLKQVTWYLPTLHANNAIRPSTVLFTSLKQTVSQLFMDLSLNLKAMVAQQLIPTPDGNSRRAAIEILS